jgi:hypothetical protein
MKFLGSACRAMRFLALATGAWGALLVLHGLTAILTGRAGAVFERNAAVPSAMLSVLATAMIAASIYLPRAEHRPASATGKNVVAPAIIAGCLAIILWIFWRGEIPASVVAGTTLIGIAAALRRLLPAIR